MPRSSDPNSPPSDAVPEPERVVSCPAPLRAEAQRALLLRLESVTSELAQCARGAREVDMPVNARRIETVRVMSAELVTMLKEDPR